MKHFPTTIDARFEPEIAHDSPRPRGKPAGHDLITQRLGLALHHLGVPPGLAAKILRSHALSIAGRTLSLHPLPEAMQTFASTVALVAELDFLDARHADQLRFALRMNTLTGLSHGCSISCTDDGMVVLLRALDLQQFDDAALAKALQAMARLVIQLHRDFQRDSQTPAQDTATLPWFTR